jgi:hypothetical protein
MTVFGVGIEEQATATATATAMAMATATARATATAGPPPAAKDDNSNLGRNFEELWGSTEMKLQRMCYLARTTATHPLR